MSQATIPLPEIKKTPLMRLVEARDRKRRDVREIVFEAWDASKSPSAVSAELSKLAGQPVSDGLFYQWLGAFGWSVNVERTLIVPEPQPAATAA